MQSRTYPFIYLSMLQLHEARTDSSYVTLLIRECDSPSSFGVMDMSSLFQIIKLARRFAAYLMALLSALKDARLFLQLAKQTSPCPFQRAPTDYFCPSFSSWLIPHFPSDNSCQTFCTESNSKYFRPCGTHGLCCHHSALPS